MNGNCFSWGLQNFYGSLHGGAVAAVAEMVSIACVRTVVAEDKEIFLGDLSISYLSAAPMNVSFMGSLLVRQVGLSCTFTREMCILLFWTYYLWECSVLELFSFFCVFCRIQIAFCPELQKY